MVALIGDLHTCLVSVADLEGIEHSVNVTAETVYEAVALGLVALRQDEWVGEIDSGLTTIHVVAQRPSVRHEIKVKDFLSWLNRKNGPRLRSRSEQGWRIAFRSGWNSDSAFRKHVNNERLDGEIPDLRYQ